METTDCSEGGEYKPFIIKKCSYFKCSNIRPYKLNYLFLIPVRPNFYSLPKQFFAIIVNLAHVIATASVSAVNKRGASGCGVSYIVYLF